jgi:hypothetical protein
VTEEVSISPNGACILVQSAGNPSLGEMKRTLAAVADLRRRHGIDRILVDSRDRSGQPPIADLYQGGEVLARELGAQARIAVLVRKLAVEHAFFENVVVNRGALVAFFEDEAAATRWLAGDSR